MTSPAQARTKKKKSRKTLSFPRINSILFLYQNKFPCSQPEEKCKKKTTQENTCPNSTNKSTKMVDESKQEKPNKKEGNRKFDTVFFPFLFAQNLSEFLLLIFHNCLFLLVGRKKIKISFSLFSCPFLFCEKQSSSFPIFSKKNKKFYFPQREKMKQFLSERIVVVVMALSFCVNLGDGKTFPDYGKYFIAIFSVFFLFLSLSFLLCYFFVFLFFFFFVSFFLSLL